MPMGASMSSTAVASERAHEQVGRGVVAARDHQVRRGVERDRRAFGPVLQDARGQRAGGGVDRDGVRERARACRHFAHERAEHIELEGASDRERSIGLERDHRRRIRFTQSPHAERDIPIELLQFGDRVVEALQHRRRCAEEERARGVRRRGLQADRHRDHEPSCGDQVEGAEVRTLARGLLHGLHGTALREELRADRLQLRVAHLRREGRVEETLGPRRRLGHDARRLLCAALQHVLRERRRAGEQDEQTGREADQSLRARRLLP